jgi:hypothetical protein
MCQIKLISDILDIEYYFEYNYGDNDKLSNQLSKMLIKNGHMAMDMKITLIGVMDYMERLEDQVKQWVNSSC